MYATDKWRIVARKGGKIVHDACETQEFTARLAFGVLAQANAEAKAYDNLELQVRRAGERRYAPVLQAVGSRVVEW